MTSPDLLTAKRYITKSNGGQRFDLPSASVNKRWNWDLTWVLRSTKPRTFLLLFFFLCSYTRFVALCIGWDNSGGNYEHFNERFKLNNGWHDWFLRLRRMLGSAFAFREQCHGAEQRQSVRKPLSEYIQVGGLHAAKRDCRMLCICPIRSELGLWSPVFQVCNLLICKCWERMEVWFTIHLQAGAGRAVGVWAIHCPTWLVQQGEKGSGILALSSRPFCSFQVDQGDRGGTCCFKGGWRGFRFLS